MAAIYINGKLCSGGTELVEEVQEGLTEAVTSDAVARYIKPVVQNVTSGVTNPVSSGAVYGALTDLEEDLKSDISDCLTSIASENTGTYKVYSPINLYLSYDGMLYIQSNGENICGIRVDATFDK